MEQVVASRACAGLAGGHLDNGYFLYSVAVVRLYESHVKARNQAAGQSHLRIQTPSFCPVYSYQKKDDFFEGALPEQSVPVKVAVDLQQQQIIRRIVSAS